MQIMAIFYSIIYIQYGAYTHHIIIGHSCVEYKEEVFVMIVSKNEILNSTTTFGGGIYSRTVKVYSFI